MKYVVTVMMLLLVPGVGAAAPASSIGRTVVLDPGHNGANSRNTSRINRLVDIGTKKKACNTTGTTSLGGLAEAQYNWDVAMRTKALLEDAGVTVVLTRQSNEGWGPCIDERARIANDNHAAALISIHADGGPSGGRGFAVLRPKLVRGLTDNTVGPSATLASMLVKSMADKTGTTPSTYLGSKGIVVSSDYGTLNLSKVPAVIVETANMRNAKDSALVGTNTFQQNVAEAITAATLEFLAASPPSVG